VVFYGSSGFLYQ